MNTGFFFSSRRVRSWLLIQVGLGAWVVVGCSGSDTTPAFTGGGGMGGSQLACAGSGVSKGPWALAATDTGVTLRWEACQSGVSGVVRYAPEAGGSEATETAVETPYEVKNTYEATLNPNATPDYAGTWFMHEATLKNLAPGTCYLYHLDAEPTRGGRFCTAQPAGQPFKFMAIGDTNPGLGEHTVSVLARVLPYSPDFVVHVGDVQYYDSGLETWAFWFDKMQPLLSQGAFFPSVGNHESEKLDEYADYYTRYFGNTFGTTTSYYHFETGGVHFFALDTEQETNVFAPQGMWLSTELQNAAATPGYRFSVVYFHKPWLTCGDKSQDTSSREAFEQLFMMHGVQLVIQGHMHGYERFELNGITYITTGGGGGALENVDQNIDRPECIFRQASGAFFHAMMVEVSAGQFRTIAIDEQGMTQDDYVKIVP